MGGIGNVDGKVFTKRSSDPGQTHYEAAGLRWLESGGAKTPEVVDVGEWSLSTRFVESLGASPEAAKELGRMLARMHASGAPRFGAPPTGFPEGVTGSAEVVTGWMGRAPLPLLMSEPEGGSLWGQFYSQFRIRPYVSDVFTVSQKAEIEELCELLEAGVFDHPQPSAVQEAGYGAARIHGDLWGGNVLWSSGAPTLIDPAAQGGHAETDLATLRTFGVPYLEKILQGYQEVSPLADGWEDRTDLHQLHILIVHCYLFGAGYVPGFMEAVRRCGVLSAS